MISSFRSWLDSRLGLTQVLQHALYEPIPSGARWRYITGSMLVFAFSVQAITGIILWACYSPSSQTAYESVYYIQHEMAGGWLLRGIHHFMAQAMVVVMGLHLLQVVVDGAYRAPREVNFWLGLVLLQIVMGLGLTGYLLPWDQKGYWATNVATNLATLVPFVGKDLQALAIGGDEYGHHTLTRFFALHTGLLPALLVGFLVLHIAVFRKHGIMAKITPGRPDQFFWPHQVLLDAAGCVILLAIVFGFAIHWDINGALAGNIPIEHRGAELGAPADASEAYSAAQPEWYFLFLFQLLKYFHGTQEIIGAIIIPGVVFTILVAMPIVGRSKAGHYFNVAFIILLLFGAAGLTAAALSEDYYAVLAPKFGWKTEGSPAVEKLMASSNEFIAAKKEAEHNAHRMHELIQARIIQPGMNPGEPNTLSAKQLIPREGAVYLMRNDPALRGPVLFAQHCSSCHPYQGVEGEKQIEIGTSVRKVKVDGLGAPILEDGKPVFADQPSGAPNLFGFASRMWIKRVLDPQQIANIDVGPRAGEANDKGSELRSVTAPVFGNTSHAKGRMSKWVKGHAEFLKEDPGKNDDDVDAIAAALSAQARLKSQAELDFADKELIARGIGLINNNCTRGCHRLGDQGQLGLAPDLTGYGSYEWMMGFVSNPNHIRFYGPENDRMPAFASNLDHPATNNVTPRELSLIVDWLRGEYYRPDDMQYADGKLKDKEYVEKNPRDLLPTWPHSAEEARLAARVVRTVAEPRPEVVGVAAEKTPDQKAQAESLFLQNCAACHNLANEAGGGIVARAPSAPNLLNFGSRQWLAGLLDPAKVDSPEYFGRTAHFEGDMVTFVKDNVKDLDDATKAKIADIVAAVSAEAQLPKQKDLDAGSLEQIERGRKAITELDLGGVRCVDCHTFRDTEDAAEAPLLTGWGSRDWLVRFMSDPGHEEFYGEDNDRMPAFSRETRPRLKKEELELIADLIRGALDAPPK